MQVIDESALLNVLVNRVPLLVFSICSCKKQNVGDPVPLFSRRSEEIQRGFSSKATKIIWVYQKNCSALIKYDHDQHKKGWEKLM
jgi:hypothetical protein